MHKPTAAFDAVELLQILLTALLLLPTLVIASPIMFSCAACQGWTGMLRRMRAPTRLVARSA